jgi:hypothetical protein
MALGTMVNPCSVTGSAPTISMLRAMFAMFAPICSIFTV